jgi:DNA-binding CsgD family transcriptional regulator
MTTLRISQLLLDLYSCPTEQGRWSVVLDQLCRALQVRSAVIQLLPPAGNGRLRSRWMVRDSRSEAARALHDRYFSDAVNPRMLVKLPPLRAEEGIFRDSDFFAPDDPLLTDLKQRLAATELGLFLQARVRMSGGEALSLVLHRDANDTHDFSTREERLALDLMPHLRQAVQLTGTLLDARSEVRHLHQTLDNFRLGLLICNEDGSLCWSNEAAEHLLEPGGALWLTTDRRLTTRSRKDTMALRQMIANAAGDAPDSDDPHLLVLRDNGREALQVRCHGLGHEASAATQELNPCGRALVMVRDPNSDSSLPPDMLGQLFGLSPAESRLAAALCVGSTLNEYAAQAGVAVGTARYQLKQVMAKTQVSKQSQLVQRLCTSVIFQLRN